MRQGRGGREGFILLWTLIVLVSMTLMATAFVYLKSAQIRGVGHDIASSQALWLAEAGIEQVKFRLWSDAVYRASPTTLTGSLGRGSFRATVTRNGNDYAVASQGTVLGIARTVQQTLTASAGASVWPAAFSYAVFGNTNASPLQIRNTVTVTGNLYYDGNVSVAEGATVTGLVYADSVTGEGQYTQATEPPDPVPAYPALDTTEYDDLISTAQSEMRSNLNLGGSNVLNLSGGTQYYRAITIRQNAQVNGPGTIVATSSITIRDNARINSDVMMITPSSLTMQDDAKTVNGATLYSRSNMTLSNNASVKGSLIVPIAGTRLTLSNSSSVQGAVYADQVRFSGNPCNVAVNGSMVAGQYYQNRITGNPHITFDALQLPTAPPSGLGVATVAITPHKDWQER